MLLLIGTAPIALNEIAIAVWLIIKGFNFAEGN